MPPSSSKVFFALVILFASSFQSAYSIPVVKIDGKSTQRVEDSARGAELKAARADPYTLSANIRERELKFNELNARADPPQADSSRVDKKDSGTPPDHQVGELPQGLGSPDALQHHPAENQGGTAQTPNNQDALALLTQLPFQQDTQQFPGLTYPFPGDPPRKLQLAPMRGYSAPVPQQLPPLRKLRPFNKSFEPINYGDLQPQSQVGHPEQSNRSHSPSSRGPSKPSIAKGGKKSKVPKNSLPPRKGGSASAGVQRTRQPASPSPKRPVTVKKSATGKK